MPRRVARRKNIRRPPARARRAPVRSIVRREIKRQEESKSYDGITSLVGVSYSGSSWNLFANALGGTTIVQGVTAAAYLGSWIEPSWLTIHGSLLLGDSTNLMRIIVLQVSGVTAPTTANLLQAVGQVETPFSPVAKTVNRFRILASKLITLDGSNTFKKWKINIPGSKMRKTHFSDAAGTPDNGGLYLFAYSDSAAATHPSIQFYSRVYYKDS